MLHQNECLKLLQYLCPTLSIQLHVHMQASCIAFLCGYNCRPCVQWKGTEDPVCFGT